MVQANVSVKIGNEWLDRGYLIDFNLSADESSIFPMCNIRINDEYGKFLAQLNELVVGNQVEVVVYEEDETVDTAKKRLQIKYPPFVIVAIMSDITGLISSSNTLEIICSHPWFLSKDYSSHAYKGMKHSDIIWNILSNDSSRSFQFIKNYKSDYWQDSDEDGHIPRYKCFESDLDFITKKLLPYTTINKSPPLFWIDELSIPHLESFKQVFSRKEMSVFTPGIGNDVLNDSTFKDKYKDLDIVFGDTAHLKISDDNPEPFIKELKAKVSYEEPCYNLTYSGDLLAKVSVGIDDVNKSLKQGKLPIDFNLIMKTEATDSKIYTNRNFDDEMALSINAQKVLYNMFSIELDCTYSGNSVRTGENMVIYIPKLQDKTRHWLNGNWHITSVKHYLSNDERGVRSKIKLIRPSFIYNQQDTSLFNPDAFYGVLHA